MCNELALTDVVEDKLKGELLDLRHGLAYLKNVKIDADKDLKVTANSKIIVICAGLRQKPGETRLSLVQRNTEIYRCKECHKSTLDVLVKRYLINCLKILV